MNSTFTWLDYSERDRNRMMRIVDGFRETSSRNDLGLDRIAGSFSEMLFPGVTVQQRRARYLLFVPWIYLHLEGQGVKPAEVHNRLRGLEVRLIDALRRSEDDAGLIGSRSRENLQRFPSNIFWSGLRRWQIFLFPGSQDQYHASLGALYRERRRSADRSDDGEPLYAVSTATWHPSLPGPPADFLETSSFEMTYEEAEFLQERIESSQPGTLLALLVGLGEGCEAVQSPWQHPYLADFPDHIRRQLRHARAFSEAAHGATLLYNHMLAEASSAPGEAGSAADGFDDELGDWADRVEQSDALASWDRDEFWRLVSSVNMRIPASTRMFFEGWCKIALSRNGPRTIATNGQARTLVTNCEHETKGPLARLSNPRRLEMWNRPEFVWPYSYGWGSTRRLLTDISIGLEGRNDA